MENTFISELLSSEIDHLVERNGISREILHNYLQNGVLIGKQKNLKMEKESQNKENQPEKNQQN